MAYEHDDVPSLRVPNWKAYCIYVLICPITKHVRYIGSTRQVGNRRRCHTRQIFDDPKTPVQAWTTAMIKAGTPPLFRVICQVRGVGWALGNRSTIFRTDLEMRRIEKRLIQDCLRQGCDLLNVAHTRKAMKPEGVLLY